MPIVASTRAIAAKIASSVILKRGVSIRSESHSNTDFVSALRDEIGYDAVNANCSKHQGDRREDCEQRHIEARSFDRIIEALRHRRDVENRLRRIDGPELGANERNQTSRILLGADDNGG